MPTHPGEERFVYRGKAARPLLVVGSSGIDVPPEQRRGMAGYQTSPTMIVAPFFGADADGSRGGYRPELVERIRHAEYPQFVWDQLPVPGSRESILRLDQLQAVGRNPQSYEISRFVLSVEALGIIDDWVSWLLTGRLAETSALAAIREVLLP